MKKLCPTGTSNHIQTPLIVLLEMQQRNLFPDPGVRSLCQDERLENCRSILKMARLSSWPVAHVLRRAPEGEYDPSDPAWRPIKGFEPICNEMTYMTQKASAFSNPHFERMMRSCQNREVILAGVQGHATSLLTVVDAKRQGITITCISDANLSLSEDAPRPDLATLMGYGMKTANFLQRFAPNDLMLRIAEA